MKTHDQHKEYSRQFNVQNRWIIKNDWNSCNRKQPEQIDEKARTPEISLDNPNQPRRCNQWNNSVQEFMIRVPNVFRNVRSNYIKPVIYIRPSKKHNCTYSVKWPVLEKLIEHTCFDENAPENQPEWFPYNGIYNESQHNGSQESDHYRHPAHQVPGSYDEGWLVAPPGYDRCKGSIV